MKYEKPIVEVMELEVADIVCSSGGLNLNGGGDNDEDSGNGNGGWIGSN